MFVIGNKVEYLSQWSKQIYCLVVNFRFIGWQYIQKFQHFVFTAIQLVKDLQNDDMYLIIGRHQLNAILVLHYSMLKTTKPEKDNKWIYVYVNNWFHHTFIVRILGKRFSKLRPPSPQKIVCISSETSASSSTSPKKKTIKSKPCFLLIFFYFTFYSSCFPDLTKNMRYFFPQFYAHIKLFVQSKYTYM